MAENVPTGDDLPLKVKLAVYGAGLFSNSISNMMNIVVPLWALALDPTPLTLGLILGARSILPLLFAIHSGALMDRIGTRRVLLFFGIMAILTTPLYPAMPFIPALIALQMFNGLAASMGWVGAQTLIGQIMRGSTRHAGRLTFASRIGAIAGPPLIGAVWDIFGAWPTFILLTLPGIAMLLTANILPPDSPSHQADGSHRPTFQIRQLLPRPADYIEAFRLLAVPAIAFVVLVAMIRISGNGVKSSFWVVYLEQIGMTGTLIGLLSSANSVAGGGSALMARAATRIMTAPHLLFFTVGLSIVLITITPLMTSFFLLLLVTALRGASMGVSQPVMISIMSKASGTRQGHAVGLRTTTNRLIAVFIPISMGALMEVFGLEMSFYIIGFLISTLMIPTLIAMRRAGLATLPPGTTSP
jgi:MFS family permease